MSASRRTSHRGSRPDAGRRRFLLAAPVLFAGAWLAGTAGRLGVRSAPAPGQGPLLLSLDQADLYGPHDLAG